MRILRSLAVAILAVTASQTVLRADSPAADPGLEAISKLSFLEGTWIGSATMRRGPGEPAAMTSRETVSSKLGGRVLLIEGVHHSGSPERLVHHALGVVSYDATTGGYRMRSYLATGQDGEYPGEIKDGAFVWGMETPNGKIRYTIRVVDGQWKEIGEIERGGTWMPFFEMTLRKEG